MTRPLSRKIYRWGTASVAAGTALMSALLFRPVLAADSQGPMIPPGEEELLAQLLGQGVTLAGCTFTGASIEYTQINAKYTCPEGEAVFELVHPSVAPRSAIPTAQFGIT